MLGIGREPLSKYASSATCQLRTGQTRAHSPDATQLRLKHKKDIHKYSATRSNGFYQYVYFMWNPCTLGGEDTMHVRFSPATIASLNFSSFAESHCPS